ncbi:MAG: hypothetical protein JO063_07410, partial [Pseudonocardiales bacterium]|nr:hypothetical protein [Pseudonocardiales bacterium]
MSFQDTTPARLQLRTIEELRMYETLDATAPQYAPAFLEHLPRARSVVLHRLLAALWREDVGAIRTAGRRLEDPRHRADPPAPASLLDDVQPGGWQVR